MGLIRLGLNYRHAKRETSSKLDLREKMQSHDFFQTMCKWKFKKEWTKHKQKKKKNLSHAELKHVNMKLCFRRNPVILPVHAFNTLEFSTGLRKAQTWMSAALHLNRLKIPRWTGILLTVKDDPFIGKDLHYTHVKCRAIVVFSFHILN